MTSQVRPIMGDDPGICQVFHRDGRMCSNEAVVIATIPIPGMEADTDVQFCRIDWADWVAAQEIDLRRIRETSQRVEPEIDIDEAIAQGEDEGD